MADYEKAVASFREALQQRESIYGSDHPLVAISLLSLGQGVGNLGDADRSAELIRRSVEIRREALGSAHPDTLESLNALSGLLVRSGKFSEAVDAFRELVPISRSLYGERHLNVGRALFNLASSLHQTGVAADLEEAGVLMQESLDIVRGLLGEEHAVVGLTRGGLGQVHLKSGRFVRAERELRGAGAVLAAALGEGHWRTASSNGNWGMSLVRLGRFEEAESVLLASHDVIVKERAGVASFETNARKRMIDLYEAWGRPDQALKWVSEE